MKTARNIVLALAWLILLSICICNPDRLFWKIALPCILAFITWIGYELRNAKEMPGDYDQYDNR